MPQWPPNTRTGIQQGSYKNIHQVPRMEVKTIQRLLICRVLSTQGQCSAGCSVTRTEAPGSGSGGGPRRRRQRTVPSLTRLTLSWVWLWCRVGHVLTLSQPLGYSSEVKTAYRQLTKVQCREDSNELNFGMPLTHKLVNNYSVRKKNEILPFSATWMERIFLLVK